MAIPPSELIITGRGSIYHIDIRPDELADTVILVGDPSRVNLICTRFNTIEFQGEHREFVWKTGFYKNKRLTVLSTGIGTDNIDIVLNELDAVANIDFDQMEVKKEHKRLKIIRLGTSGALQKDIVSGSIVCSEYALGFDPVLHFYAHDPAIRDTNFEEEFMKHVGWAPNLNRPYLVKSSPALFNAFKNVFVSGVTISAPGFYGPQGRQLRLPLAMPGINDKIPSFEKDGRRIVNYEMEGSAIYALSALLGHDALTICTIIANRVNNTFDNHFNDTIQRMIDTSLSIIEALND